MKPIRIAQPMFGLEEIRAVARVLRSGRLASGPEVEAFENAFAKYVGTRHAVATSNGTAGLHAALVALGVGRGDEVIVPAFSFVATANIVLLAGARPVFADIDPRTFNLRPESAAEAITVRTKCIVPVHLFGHPADMSRLERLAARHGLALLGDAAQAHGTAIGGRRVGSFGDCEAFSFYPTKNMTTGEGGMVTTDDAKLAERIRSFINHGRRGNRFGTYDHAAVGHNYRMTEMQAAIGRVQLRRLERLNRKRRANARWLTRALGATPGLLVPTEAPGTRHVYHQYTVRSRRRDLLVRRLRGQRIDVGVYYPRPLHRYPHLAPFARRGLEESERAAREVVSLPVHPALTRRDLSRIVRAVQRGVA